MDIGRDRPRWEPLRGRKTPRSWQAHFYHLILVYTKKQQPDEKNLTPNALNSRIFAILMSKRITPTVRQPTIRVMLVTVEPFCLSIALEHKDRFVPATVLHRAA